MQRLLKYEYLFLLPLLLSAVFSLKSFWQKWPKQYRLFAVLLIISLLTEVFAISWKWYLHKMFTWDYSKNNLWIYNIFITVRLGILLAIFYQILQSPRIKKAILYTGPLLVLFGLLNYAVIQGPYQYNTYSVMFAHIPITILCLCYFKQLLEETTTRALHKEPMVWMAFGILVYHATSLPFLIMLNFLNTQPSGLAMLYLPINMTLNLLMCFFYLISFLCRPQ
jgi:hypothetical protein